MNTRWHAPVMPSVYYSDVIMGVMASQITSLTIVCSTVYSGANQRKHQSSASLAFVRGIHRSPVNSLHKWPVTRKMFPFDDVITYFFLWTEAFKWVVTATFTYRGWIILFAEHFENNIFKYIFFNGADCILIEISPKFLRVQLTVNKQW